MCFSGIWYRNHSRKVDFNLEISIKPQCKWTLIPSRSKQRTLLHLSTSWWSKLLMACTWRSNKWSRKIHKAWSKRRIWCSSKLKRNLSTFCIVANWETQRSCCTIGAVHSLMKNLWRRSKLPYLQTKGEEIRVDRYQDSLLTKEEFHIGTKTSQEILRITRRLMFPSQCTQWRMGETYEPNIPQTSINGRLWTWE